MTAWGAISQIQSLRNFIGQTTEFTYKYIVRKREEELINEKR